MRTITKAAILQALNSNPLAVERALVLLYEGQTRDEQLDRTTHHTNGMGFNYHHAGIGSALARIVQRGGHLNRDQLARGRGITSYYAGTQLLQAAIVKANRSDDAKLASIIASHPDPFAKTVGVGFLFG
jgi:hypothetical protein